MVLLESLKFIPCHDKEIRWTTRGIAKPTTVDGNGDYQLPIIVRSIV